MLVKELTVDSHWTTQHSFDQASKVSLAFINPTDLPYDLGKETIGCSTLAAVLVRPVKGVAKLSNCDFTKFFKSSHSLSSIG
ncbi:hypothetical protein Enr13x_09150 [Stieleria neptunia]|uniref:Uncharacterized protein n=1 Tax=Stieleria neptunia TaxID=2527979 RepID=A0A518HJP7_9BACT|nr:hypothetical protein Enr13x_09150 [Stieleria neptunia]